MLKVLRGTKIHLYALSPSPPIVNKNFIFEPPMFETFAPIQAPIEQKNFSQFTFYLEKFLL